MDDEVFVTVTYRHDDFVRVQRNQLVLRLRETNTPQIAFFVAVAAIGALFLAPDPIGRIFASAAGALLGLIGILFVWGFIRAARPAPLPIEKASLEISSAGVFVKSGDRYVHRGWREFEHVTDGMGIVWFSGPLTVVVPLRALRKDQIATLRALVHAHAVSESGGALPAAAEQNDGGRG